MMGMQRNGAMTMNNNGCHSANSRSSRLATILTIAFTIITVLYIQTVNAACTAGTGWQSYPPTTSSIQCPPGTIVIAIQARANQWNNLGLNGVPSSYNITCSDGSTRAIGNGATDTNWPLISCPYGFSGIMFRADTTQGILWNIEPQCNDVATMLLGSTRVTTQIPVSQCTGGDIIGLQATYNSQIVQCLELICNTTAPPRPIAIYEYNNPSRGGGKPSLLLAGRPLVYQQPYEFGSVPWATSVTRYFRIRNPDPVAILTLYAINATTGYNINRWSIACASFSNAATGALGATGWQMYPGDTLDLTITYTGVVGSQLDVLPLTIYSSAPIYPIWTANMTAHSTSWAVQTTVAACGSQYSIQDRDPAASDACLRAPTINKGYSTQTSGYVLILTNQGAAFTYTIDVIAEGSYAYEFMTWGNPTSGTLSMEGAIQIGIQFQPSLGGIREAIVRISTNDDTQASWWFTIQGYGTDQQLVMTGIGTNTNNGDGRQSIQDRGSVIAWGDVPYGWPTQPSSPAVALGRVSTRTVQFQNIGSYGSLWVYVPQMPASSYWRINSTMSSTKNLNFTLGPSESVNVYINLTSTGSLGFHNDSVQVLANQYMWGSQWPNGYPLNFSVSHTVVELSLASVLDDYVTSYGYIYNGKTQINVPDGTAYIGTNYLVGATKLFAMDQFSIDNAPVNITSISLSGGGASQFSIALNTPRPLNHGAIAFIQISFKPFGATMPMSAVVTIVTDLPRGPPTNTYTFGIAGVAMGMKWVSLNSTTIQNQLLNAVYIPVNPTPRWYPLQLWIESPNGANSTFSFTCKASFGVNATWLQFNTSVNLTTTTMVAPNNGYSATPRRGNLTCTNVISTDIIYSGAPIPVLPIFIQGRITVDRVSLLIYGNSDAIFQVSLSHVIADDVQLAIWSPSSMVTMASTWIIPGGSTAINITVHGTAAAINVIKFSASSVSWVYNFANVDDLPFTILAGCAPLSDQPGASGVLVNNHTIAAVGDMRYFSCGSGYALGGGAANATCTATGWTAYNSTICITSNPTIVGGAFLMDGIYFVFDRNMSQVMVPCEDGLTSSTLYSVQASSGTDSSNPVCYWGGPRTWVVKWAVTSSLIVGETIGLRSGVFRDANDATKVFAGDTGIPDAPTVGLPTTLNVTIMGPVSTRQQPSIGKCEDYMLTALVAGDVVNGRNGLMARYEWSIMDSDQILTNLQSQGFSAADINTLTSSVQTAVDNANAARDSTNQGTSLLGYPSWTVPPAVTTGNFSVTWKLTVTHWTGIKVNTTYTVFISKLIAPNITLSNGISATVAYGTQWNNTATTTFNRVECTTGLRLKWYSHWTLISVINGTWPATSVIAAINNTMGSPSAMVSVNTSLLTSGATYTFSVTAQNQTLLLPGLTRIGGNRTVTLTIGAPLQAIDPTYTPVLLSARLADDGRRIRVTFDAPTNQPGGTSSFDCGQVFDASSLGAKMGTTTTCAWADTTTLAIITSTDAYYDWSTTNLTLKAGVVKSESQQSGTSLAATVSIQYPLNPEVPLVPAITGNTTVIRCQTMSLSVTTITVGAGGRAAIYTWNVTTSGGIVLQSVTSVGGNSFTVNQALLTVEQPTLVSLSVKNWLGVVANTTSVWVTSTMVGTFPPVTLSGGYYNRTIARVDVLQLDAVVGTGICGVPAITYLWSIVSGGPPVQTSGVTMNSVSLTIPTKRFTAANATYMINFRAWSTAQPSLFVTWNVSVMVTSSPLIAVMDGIATGTELFISRANALPLSLNASQSNDPDVAEALRRVGLSYQWTCTWLSNGARCFPAGSGADNTMTAASGSPYLSIPMSQLSDTTVSDGYVFKVSVSKDTRVTNASVIAHVLTAPQLSVTTRVRAANVYIYDGIVSPTLPFELVATIDSSLSSSAFTYVWTCVMTTSGASVNLTMMQLAGRLRTGTTGPYLGFIAGALTPGVSYTFTVVATQTSNSVTGTSIVSVITDTGASGGACSITPLVGDITTSFTGTCSNWNAFGAVPLTYAWSATAGDGSSFQLATGTSASMQLAPGFPPLNQRTITITITNSRNTAITMSVNITVSPLSANTSATDVIGSLANRLTPEAAASDPAAFSQAYAISTSLLSSLNSSARASVASALVSAVVGLANGTVATADSVAQRVALVSQVASTAATDLTADARASICDLLVQTTEAALSLGACTPSLATSALTSFGNVLAASSSTNYSSTDVTSEASSLASKFTAAISAAARGLVYGQLPGETVTISTSAVTLQAAANDPSSLAGSSFTIAGQTFALPSSIFTTLYGNASTTTPSSIGYSASVQNASLFDYAANGTVSGSSLVSVSLFDASSISGGVLNVTNITSEIDIVINHSNITVIDDTDVSGGVDSDLTIWPPRAVPTCRWFDFKLNGWATRGCRRDAASSTSTRTVCKCTHLTDFNIELGTFHAPQITAITTQDILNLADLPQHPTAMIWLAGLWALYFILVPVAKHVDEKKHMIRASVPQTKHDPTHWRHPSMKGATRFQKWRAYVRDHFRYDHLWFSVAFRRANDNFSSTERLTCVFVVIIGSMAISAVFWSHDQGGRIGTIVVGVISSVALMPAAAGLRFIFRRAGTDPTGGINHGAAIRRDQFIRATTGRLGGLPASALANQDTATGDTAGDKYKSTASLPSLPENAIAVEMTGTPTAAVRTNQVAPASSPPMGHSARLSPVQSDAAPLLPAGGDRSSSPNAGATSPGDKGPLVGRSSNSANASKRSLVGHEIGAVRQGAFGVEQERTREEVKSATTRASLPATGVSSPTTNGANDEKTAMLPVAASSAALATPAAPTGDNGVIKGTSSSEELFDHHGRPKKARKRCCCAIPRALPLYWKNIGWTISVIWALGCSFIILVYGVKFDEFDHPGDVGLTTSSRWMLSSLCSNVQAVFINEPVSILVKASLSVFFGNLVLKLVECIADTDLTS